jgi:sulfopyruvate decarboxylase subunit alpha
MAKLVIPALVEHVVTVPDSLLTRSLRAPDGALPFQYIQVTHETQAVALTAGLSLGSRRALACMESSGLRAACESIARLTCLHGIGIVTVVCDRGDFGDPNWWAQEHATHARSLIQMFGWRSTTVREEADFADAITQAFLMVDTRMISVAIFVSSELLRR